MVCVAISPAGLAAAVEPDGTYTRVSPSVAADAPWTKTVNWLVDQTTPKEQIKLIEGNWANKTQVDLTTDPDNHGEAGYVAGIKRLGIPDARHADALGIEAFADATAYPTRLGIASSFDREALNKFGAQVGQDGLDMDMDLVYGPQVDLARTPSWSRNMTAYSEDPYLASELTAQEINGIQSTGLLSQVKHVSFYSGQSQSVPSLVGEQAAREIYLAPAEAAAKRAGVTSMMCSYATFQILGYEDKPDYACSNAGMLNGIIKGEWNFPGWITTDYGGGKDISDLLAGTDQEFLTTFLAQSALLPKIDTTSASYDPQYAAAARTSVARILYQYERFGLLDNDYIPASVRSDVPQDGDVDSTDNTITIDKSAGIKEALKLAEEAAVLLKNDDSVLPLSKDASVSVSGIPATLLPAGPGGERANGFGDRINITPFKAMKATASTDPVLSPGIDAIGTTIPTTALSQDAAGTLPGLSRATTIDGNTVTTADSIVDGRQSNIAKGSTVVWTGYVNVTSEDDYRLIFQRPMGQDLGNADRYNDGVRNLSSSTLTLAVDDVNKQLGNPDSKILNNAYPTFASGTSAEPVGRNGQYLGYQNVANLVHLTPGRHKVSFTYKPTTQAASAPTLRFAWSAVGATRQAAVDAAATKDVSVVFVDDGGARTGDGVSAQTDVARLSVEQEALVTQVAAAAHAADNKVIVVVNSGGAIQMPWADDVDGIVEMWYPGQEGGTATANVLYGDVNPSGKLPLTFPTTSAESLFGGHPERGAGTQEPGETATTIKWTEGLDIGYRWYESDENVNGYKPRFAFGHGLSYTSFDYSGLKAAVAKDGGLDVSFTVRNTGDRDGSESPQVYLGTSPDLDPAIEQAPVKLVQFDKVDLEQGESKKVSLHVTPRELSSWSIADQSWVIGTGSRAVTVGAASDDIRLTTSAVVPATVEAPVVTDNPDASVTVNAGAEVTLSAAATGSPAPTVVWQRSNDNGVSWSPVAGADSTELVFTAVAGDDNAQFRAVFSNTLGDAVSDASTVHVRTKPVISQNPVATVSSTVGKTVTLRATASGTPAPSVVWERSADNGATWSAIAGATSTELKFTAKRADNGALYRATFTNAVGSTSTSTSKVTVAKAKATVTVTASKSKYKVPARVKATVSVTSSAPGADVGKVTVTISHAGKTVKTVTGTLKNGKVTVSLPQISKKGTYKLVAKYAGSTDASSASSKAVTVKLVK
jgi:beta-glucosidase